jgi:putative flippase GtrA
MALRDLLQERHQFSRFAIVGLANTGLDAAIFSGLVIAFNAPPVLANVVAFCVALVNSYLLNLRWTFGSLPLPVRDVRRFFRFAKLGTLVAALATLILWGLVQVGLDVLTAKAVTVVLSMGVNYFTASRLIFDHAGMEVASRARST